MKLWIRTMAETAHPGMNPSCSVITAEAINGSCTAPPRSHPHHLRVPADQSASTWRLVSSHGQ
jgi:hypothetical protein